MPPLDILIGTFMGFYQRGKSFFFAREHALLIKYVDIAVERGVVRAVLEL